MADSPDTTSQIDDWIAGLQAGDSAAREVLVHRVAERLHLLTRRMLQSRTALRPPEHADHSLECAELRLQRALLAVPPHATVDLLRLAALSLRGELLGLCRHFFGPQALGMPWAVFHEQAGRLPDAEREAFDLIWYLGLSQAEAAQVLGVLERTIKRRWQAARLRLHEALHGDLPT